MDVKDQAKQQALETFKKLQAATQPQTQINQPQPDIGGYFEKGVDFGKPLPETGAYTIPSMLGNFVVKIGEDIVNIPANIGGGAYDIYKGQTYKGLGRIGQGVFDLATTVIPAGKGLKALKGAELLLKAGEVAAKPALKEVALQGIKEGSIYGGLSGAFQGLQEAQNVAPEQRLGTVTSSILGGGLTGGLLGGGLSALGYKLTAKTPKVFEGLSQESSNFLNKQINAQEAAVKGSNKWLNNLSNELKVKFEDFTTHFNNALDNYEKQSGKKIPVSQDPRIQIDRVLNASQIADTKFWQSDYGKALLNVPDVRVFDQYLISKEVIARNQQKGLISNVDYKQAQKFIDEVKNIYEPAAQTAYKYNQSLLKDYFDAGMLKKETYDVLKQNSQYVPLQRLFEEIDNNLKGGGAGVASVAKQNLVKTAEGSKREIKNVSESIFANTMLAQKQIEKNKASRMIYDLVGQGILPGKIFKKGEKFNTDNVIYALIDGEKVAIDVGKDIASGLKNLNKENITALGKFFRTMTRVLQGGAVTFNIPFAIRNVVKDAQTAAVYSKSPISKTVLNPINFVKTIYDIAGKTQLYDDYIKAGIGFSSIEAANLPKTIQQMRATQTLSGSMKYYATKPWKLFGVIENIIGKGEQIARLQNFGVRREYYLKKGYNLNEATTLAANEARNLTANFARRGEWSNVVNGIIPFFNAGVQGAKQLRTRFVQNPVATTTRFVATIGFPVAAATLWNTSDPERKKIYDSIPEFEKERALIILPPVPYKDDKGQIVALRIPMAPGLSNLANPIRKLLDGSYASGYDLGAGIASDLTSALYSQPLPLTSETARQTVSTLTPQAIKPFVESTVNQNLYTGAPIIPRGKENLPAAEQVRPDTSFTARKIGNTFGISPAIVENFIKTSTAGVGTQTLSILDWAASKVTDVPEEQRANKGILTDAFNSFFRTKGGADVAKIYDQLKQIDQEQALLNLKMKDAILKGDTNTIDALSENMTKQQYSALKASVEKQNIVNTLSETDKALYNLSTSQLESLRQRNPGLSDNIDNVLELKKTSDSMDNPSLNSKYFRFKPSNRLRVSKRKRLKKFGFKKPRIKGFKVAKPKKIKKLKIKTFK